MITPPDPAVLVSFRPSVFLCSRFNSFNSVQQLDNLSTFNLISTYLCAFFFFNRWPRSEGGRVQRYCWCAGPHQQLHQVPRYERAYTRVRVCLCLCADWGMWYSSKTKKQQQVIHLMSVLFVKALTPLIALLFCPPALLNSLPPRSTHKYSKCSSRHFHTTPLFSEGDSPLWTVLLSTKLFTSPFFTPAVFACVDILCNLFDPPGHSPLGHSFSIFSALPRTQTL